MQFHVLEAEIVLGLHLHGDLFDGRRFEIAPRPGHLDLRRFVALRLDEVIFAEANVVAAFQGSDVKLAVLLNGHGGRQQAVWAFVQGQFRAIVHHQNAAGQRLIGGDGDLGLGAFHGAQIAARIFHFILQSQPRRVMVSDANFLDAGEVHYA